VAEIPTAVEAELARLRAEDARLLKLLKLTPQQAAPPGPAQASYFEAPPGLVHHRSAKDDKVAFFGALFAARTDVYAIRFDNHRTGKSGWIPAVRGGCRRESACTARCGLTGSSPRRRRPPRRSTPAWTRASASRRCVRPSTMHWSPAGKNSSRESGYPTRTTGTCSRRRSGAARRASKPRTPRTSPAAALEPLGLEAVHPDDFLLDQLDLSPPTILQIIREQAARTRRPPLTPRDLAILLGRAGTRLRRRDPPPHGQPPGRHLTGKAVLPGLAGACGLIS
jgi:hypothetical protein